MTGAHFQMRPLPQLEDQESTFFLQIFVFSLIIRRRFAVKSNNRKIVIHSFIHLLCKNS